MASSSAMHREVIKWLQTLELTSALTNPRRDLMNGFVVAEILHRYSDKVQLHSFDTGAALARRLDNWQQLETLFKARGFNKEVTPQLLREVMMGQPGAAQQLIEKLYTHLTKRQLKQNLPAEREQRKAEEARPAYMAPTAAELVRLQNTGTASRLRQLTGEIDEAVLESRNKALYDAQLQARAQDRLQNRARYEYAKLPMKTLIALAKGQRDGTYMGGHAAASFDVTAGGGAAAGSAAATQLTASRARQRLAAAKQLDLRTHNPALVSAFQQRQQHERDEQFRAAFDPDEDICRALSRVVARPLQHSGHFSLALELAGIPRAVAEALPAVDCAPSSPKFPRADIVSVIVSQPAESSASSNSNSNSRSNSRSRSAASAAVAFPMFVVDACFEQLHNSVVKHNAAKLLQQRPDDVVHLVALLDLALDSGNGENFVRVCHMLEEIGHHLLKLDPSGRTFGIRDELIAGVCPRLAEVAPGLPLTALCRMLVAFTNVRDVDAVRQVLEGCANATAVGSLLAAKPAPAVTTAQQPLLLPVPGALSDVGADSLRCAETRLPATLFHCMAAADLKNAESLAVFYASRLVQGEPGDSGADRSDNRRRSQSAAACGWEIFRCVAPASSAAAATAVHYASQLAMEIQREIQETLGGSGGDDANIAALGINNERWEVLLLALTTILGAVIAHHGEWSDDADEADDASGSKRRQPTGAELLDLTEVTAVRLFEAIVQGTTDELERRAAFCAVAPLLRSDLAPSVSVAFVQHFLELPPAEREGLLSSSSSSSSTAAAQQHQHHHHGNGGNNNISPAGKHSLPALTSCTGKADVYVAGGLASLWPVEELLLILRVLQQSLSSLQVVEMLAALLVDETVAAHAASWEEALRFAKADLVNATRNPVDLRDVPDALLPRCQALAAHVLATLYAALNPADAAAAAAGATRGGNSNNNNGGGAAVDADGEDDEDFDSGDDVEDDALMDGDAAAEGEPANGGNSDPTTPSQARRVPAGAIDWLQSM